MSSSSCMVSQTEAICKQVEYYLSDENLPRDLFFKKLIFQDPGGWIDPDPVLSCNRIKQLGVSSPGQLIEALKSSEILEVKDGRLRRKTPFMHTAYSEDSKGPRKGGKGKGKMEGKGKGRDEMQVPVYDPSGPCGYFMAGYCQRGKNCHTQHSIPYAMTIRSEWLHPGNVDTQNALRSAAVQLLGDQAKDLFPRVFSQRLQCKTAAHITEDLSDLGFEWSTGAASSEPQTEKRSRWSRRSGKADDSNLEYQATEAPKLTPKLRYFLVFDLEGKHEIIEFPVLLFDAVTGAEIGRFQKFVRPTKLFEGCPVTETPAIPFPAVLAEFDSWLQNVLGRGLEAMGKDTSDMVFVTCGDWDCKHVWTQCQICGVPAPRAFSRWINIKRSYADTYGGDFRGMKSMLLGMLRVK